MLKNLINHPLTKNLKVDDPNTTILRKEIIKEKRYLRSIYIEWYKNIIDHLDKKNNILELGSGAGFLSDYLPDVITTEIMQTPGVKIVADGCNLPIADHSLNAIVMTDVLHHIPNVEKFFHEAQRCIKPKGKIIMVEPWNTSWSRFIYKNIHPEPFEVNSDWSIPLSGPLSGANGALPWILFQRDKELFTKRFPHIKINHIKPMMPLSYLLSGGVSMRSLAPGLLYKPVRWIEKKIERKMLAMFALIELQIENE